MKRIALLLIIFIPSVAFPQLDTEKALHQQILINLSKDLKEHYYDPNMHGVDLDASVKQARQLISVARSATEMTDIVARILIPFDDSHLGFFPPATTVSIRLWIRNATVRRQGLCDEGCRGKQRVQERPATRRSSLHV